MTTPSFFTDSEPAELTQSERAELLGEARASEIGQIGWKKVVDPETGETSMVYDTDDIHESTSEMEAVIIQEARDATGEIELSDIQAMIDKKKEA